MKTAISMPDDTFRAVTERAAAMGMSRSELITVAVRHYIDVLDEVSLVEQIDAAADIANRDEASRAVVATGRRRLAADADTW